MNLLDQYIEAAALRAFLLVTLVLTTLFSLLAFVEQLGSIGQGHYGVGNALVYVLLTAPSRILQVAPVSILLGSLLGLGTLAKHSELTVMRSLGLSERRIIVSVLKLAAPIILAMFLMAEFVVPQSEQLAQTERTAALSASAPLRSDNNFWAEGDHQYLNVQKLAFGNVPDDIDVYTFTPDGSLVSILHAQRAEIQPDGTWLLLNVVRKTITAGQFQTDHLPTLAWHSFLSPKQMQLLVLPPESMPPVALYQYVRHLEQNHQQAVRYEQELWTKASIPFSIIAMIMIAAPFVFGPPRAQGSGQLILVGAIVGMVFSLSQQIADQLGLLLNLNPAVSALTPSLLLMAVAIYLFRREHR
ncbi:MAG: LPS export ABC transporter permease LptG [Geothrix sp.]|nr:LPS export ABC transporter permease LptG [Geothrix sp.]